MINLKSPEEIEIMKAGGKISVLALKAVLVAVEEGITTLELDRIAENTILKNGAKSSFKTVDDYKYTTCININAGIVHGLPSHYKLKKGDLVSIDLGVLYKGFHTDLSYTVEVSTTNEQKFLNTGLEAMRTGVFECIDGNHMGDVSFAIQSTIEGAGYSVSRDLVGHGIGRDLHEDPYVPGYGKRNRGIELKEGMVLAVEAIYQKGRSRLILEPDDWTLTTADNSLSALFEQTVVVTKKGPIILTEI